MQWAEFRAMTAADIEAANRLATDAGFRDRLRFLEFALRVGTAQPMVAVADGGIVATGLASANGPVGWLGGIVVAEAYRGRGLGRAMTEKLMWLLGVAGCTTLSLESTDAGRRMYENLGFRTATHYHQMQADHIELAAQPPDGAVARPLLAADLPAVFDLDRQATAEDRGAALAVLAEAQGWVLERDGSLAGFLLPAERAYGAVIAPRFDDGLFLLDLHRSLVPAGEHVRAGVPEEHEAAAHELQARGWQETWLAPRMLLGPDVPWRPQWIWGQINSAMG